MRGLRGVRQIQGRCGGEGVARENSSTGFVFPANYGGFCLCTRVYNYSNNESLLFHRLVFYLLFRRHNIVIRIQYHQITTLHQMYRFILWQGSIVQQVSSMSRIIELISLFRAMMTTTSTFQRNKAAEFVASMNNVVSQLTGSEGETAAIMSLRDILVLAESV